ncbi:hypothetical protein SOCE26_023650 [Sorangium cellulosum]|uniref:Uncharacterized protein n=1 Tax=Sorangium cellulosum TaxID=56 RepID=A0A2L0ENT1_SORCE|nr:hypothetical protein SOCE26_023650 [Sorangium cellulosum]
MGGGAAGGLLAGGGAAGGGAAGGGPRPGGGARLRERKGYAYGVSAGLVLLMLAPLFRRPPVDSFPLSTYPMFSWGRHDARTTVERAVGVGARGERRPIPPRLVGSEEVLQAKATLAQSIRQGARAARALCRGIAARVAEQDSYADVVAIELRTDTFDAVAFFEGQEAPVDSKVHATCKVRAR